MAFHSERRRMFEMAGKAVLTTISVGGILIAGEASDSLALADGCKDVYPPRSLSGENCSERYTNQFYVGTLLGFSLNLITSTGTIIIDMEKISRKEALLRGFGIPSFFIAYSAYKARMKRELKLPEAPTQPKSPIRPFNPPEPQLMFLGANAA